MPKLKKSRSFSSLTSEEWHAVRRYQRLSLQKKLELMDRMRSLMFDLWKANPSLYPPPPKYPAVLRRG